jgi:membrane-associated PAP2 superfamily phosphatase
MNIVREINTFYRVLGTECPKYRNIRVTEDDLKNELILSEVLYDLEDNVYVYEGAEELYHDIIHRNNKKRSICNAVTIIGITLIIAGFLLVLGTAGASDLNTIPFSQMILQTIIGLGITIVGFITLKIINKMEE